jgi:hypothetical protein
LAQIFRWTQGHNQVLARYAHRLLGNRRCSLAEKFDGLLLLNVYVMSLVLLWGWGLGIVLWYLGVTKPGLIVILVVTTYSTLGNFATFFEITTAAHLDGSRQRIRLLPFIMFGFLVSLMSVARATLIPAIAGRRKGVRWQRTERSNGNGSWS